VLCVPAYGAAEEGGCGQRLLVGEDLGVGQAAVVVDGDVRVLEAGGLATVAVGVGASGAVVLRSAADTRSTL
jgi:hypothetical protein